MSKERATFVIEAMNRRDVLTRVIILFHKLNLEIQAVGMRRTESSETMRLCVTIEANAGNDERIKACLRRIIGVMSVIGEYEYSPPANSNGG
jgi:acetolactate synthase small subunit